MTINSEAANVSMACQSPIIKVESSLYQPDGQCTHYNVINAADVSKVLQELTQCMANDKDLFSIRKRQSAYEQTKREGNYEGENGSKSDCSSLELSSSNVASSPVDSPNASLASHVCNICKKQFRKRDFLQKHKIVHEAPRHRCVICDKAFVREDKLKRHFLSIHSRQRPHVCDICSKAFARKDKLKEHRRHHSTTGDSFQCRQCRIPFVQKSDLNRHVRTAHDVVMDDVKSKYSTKSTSDSHSNDNTSTAPTTTTSNSPQSQIVMPYQINSLYPSVVGLNNNLQLSNSSLDSSNLIFKPAFSLLSTFPVKVQVNCPISSFSNAKTLGVTNCDKKSTSSLEENKTKPDTPDRTNVPIDTSDISNLSNTETKKHSVSVVSPVPTSFYSRIPIITPFQSPMISVFPTQNVYSSTTSISTSTGPSVIDSYSVSKAIQPSTNPTFTSSSSQSALSVSPFMSTVFQSSQFNVSLKPNCSLGSSSIAIAHHNLCQFQHNNSQLRYCSCLPPGSPFVAGSSWNLPTHLYPNMPF